eukprot:725621-Pelagomonas_calceolata.AAC.1
MGEGESGRPGAWRTTLQPIIMREFVVDFRKRLRGVWNADASAEHNVFFDFPSRHRLPLDESGAFYHTQASPEDFLQKQSDETVTPKVCCNENLLQVS